MLNDQNGFPVGLSGRRNSSFVGNFYIKNFVILFKLKFWFWPSANFKIPMRWSIFSRNFFDNRGNHHFLSCLAKKLTLPTNLAVIKAIKIKNALLDFDNVSSNSE